MLSSIVTSKASHFSDSEVSAKTLYLSMGFSELNPLYERIIKSDYYSAYQKSMLEMKALNRSRKLISKINSALQRIKDGTYGYCEETGEPIGLKRLMARPVATLSIEAQERHERDEKIFIDD